MLQNILKKPLIILILIFSFYSIKNIHGEILYPENNQIVNKKQIHIIGKLKKSEDIEVYINEIAINVNRGLLIKMRTKDGIFYMYKVDVELREGENIISVKGFSVNDTIILDYRKNYSDRLQHDKKTFFHMNDNNFYCKKCHDFNKSEECIICHNKNVENKYVHGPVVALQCFICHDKNNYFSIKQPLSVHCLKCHQEFSDAMYNAKYAHAPSVAGYCTICHNPHTSTYKFFLINNINKLCLRCHEYKKTGYHIAKKNIKGHENILCSKCHNSHYGKTKELLKGNNNKKTICKGCHN